MEENKDQSPREFAREMSLLAACGFCFGVPFGGGCYLGWALLRGLFRLLSP